MSARGAKPISKAEIVSPRSVSRERRIEITFHRAAPTSPDVLLPGPKPLFETFTSMPSFEAKETKLANSRAELLENVRKIDECVEKLTNAIADIRGQLTACELALTSRLSDLKSALTLKIDTAVDEVTAGMTDPTPFLQSGLANAIWNCDNLSLFSYKLHTETVTEMLTRLVEIELRDPPDREAPVVTLEQDWKPETVTAKSWVELPAVPDMLTDKAKAALSRLRPFAYILEIAGGEAKGPIELSDGSVYTGQWRNGKRFGKGTMVTPAGGLLEGYWNDGLHLRGRYIYPNGDWYEGGFCHMKRDGYGVFLGADGKTSYKGGWGNGLKDGKGVEELTDGSEYDGEFRRDKKHGRGVFRWPNGEVYDGQFNEQRIEGNGKYTWGEMKWYEGEWIDGKMHGKGRQVNEGKDYEGSFLQDKKHGVGTMKWSGNVYEGEWAEGQMHGKGFLTLKGRDRKQYLFQNNKKIEEIR